MIALSAGLGVLAAGGGRSAAGELPSGGTVTAGTATIGAPAAGALVVRQTSPRAVVDWTSFSIGRGNAVSFVQPGAGAAVLNRVTGSTGSSIAGSLSANGRVYLVNPNGIQITPTGAVRAAGFTASTLAIGNQDFMAGKDRFVGSGASAAVSNGGRIVIDNGGDAVLIGGHVGNARQHRGGRRPHRPRLG